MGAQRSSFESDERYGVESAGGGDFWVTSATNNRRYLVTGDPDGLQCTCRWAKYHDTSVDPCAHIVAVHNALAGDGNTSPAVSGVDVGAAQSATGGDALGQFEQATALRGAAVKLANAYGVDPDDVAQDMAINALQVRREYGFEHVNTIVWCTRRDLGSERYGVNRYYHGKGIAEVDLADGADDADRMGVFADDAFDWDDIDLALAIDETMGELPELERGIAAGFMADLTGLEIADRVGCHNVTVSRKKGELRKAFAWALG